MMGGDATNPPEFARFLASSIHVLSSSREQEVPFMCFQQVKTAKKNLKN